MSWIQSDTTLTRKPKFKRFIRKLSLTTVEGIGHLTLFWQNVMELAEDGDISKWSIEDIAEYSNWEKDPNSFYKVLVDDVWIEKTGNLTLIHDWLDYAGGYLKAKYRTSNPKRLKQIYKKHKIVLRMSLGSNKTDKIDMISKIRLDKITLDNIIEQYIKTKGLSLHIKEYPEYQSEIYRSQGRAVKRLYVALNKNCETVCQAIDRIGRYFNERRLDWNLYTICKHLDKGMGGSKTLKDLGIDTGKLGKDVK